MRIVQIMHLMVATLPTIVMVVIGIVINNAQISDLRAEMGRRFSELDRQMAKGFDRIASGAGNLDRRFVEMRELWRSELHRVEEILDVRLKHLEER